MNNNTQNAFKSFVNLILLVFRRLLLSLKLVFECKSTDTGYFLLGDRLGCLGTNKVPEDCRKFIDAGCAFEQSYQRAIMLSPFLCRWWPTKDYKTMTRSTEVLTHFVLKHMEQKMQKIKQMSSSIDDEVKQQAGKVDFLTPCCFLRRCLHGRRQVLWLTCF